MTDSTKDNTRLYWAQVYLSGHNLVEFVVLGVDLRRMWITVRSPQFWVRVVAISYGVIRAIRKANPPDDESIIGGVLTVQVNRGAIMPYLDFTFQMPKPVPADPNLPQNNAIDRQNQALSG